MANFSDEERSLAQEIISGLFSGNKLSDDPKLPLEDIERDVEQFIADLNLYDRYDVNKIPVIQVGDEQLPILLSYYLGINSNVIRSFGKNYYRHYFEDFLFNVLGRNAREEYVFSSPENARSTFQRLAIDFVATRIAHVYGNDDSIFSNANRPLLNIFKRGNVGGRIMTPGCNFSVSTKSTGLRVFWSGGYAISPKYFSSPTSPASSVLQSGTFVFGVDGGAYGSTIQWDNALVTLPGFPSIDLDF